MDLYKIAKNWKNVSEKEKQELKLKINTVIPKQLQNDTISNVYETKNRFSVELEECSVLINADSKLTYEEWPCECGVNGCDDSSFDMF